MSDWWLKSNYGPFLVVMLSVFLIWAIGKYTPKYTPAEAVTKKREEEEHQNNFFRHRYFSDRLRPRPRSSSRVRK